MMSYLWILLLGSLLATSAKAQDVEAPTEEKASETPALEADTPTEVAEEPAAEHTAEEISPTTGETEHEAEASEPETPVVEEAETVDTPTADTGADTGAGAEAGAEAEAGTEAGTEAGAEAEAEAGTEAGTEAGAEAEAEAEAGTEAGTEAGAEAEAEAATTKQADLEVVDSKTEEPTVLGEEEATSSTGETPAQESASEATTAAGPAVADDEEESTVPAAADAEPTQPAVDGKVEPEVEVPDTTKLHPIVKVETVPEGRADVEFSLGDALPEKNAVDSPGQRRSFESGPHVAGASGEADKPEAQEAGSGSIAGILSAVAVSVVGAIVGFFTYKKKKLCFKNRQEADPEAARKADATEAQADPQVLSNLLNSS